jgi:alcohol dehydrogenase (cytochrome c)
MVNWTKGLDPKTGKPLEYDPRQKVQNYGPGKSVRAGRPETSQNVCPNWVGSPTLMPPSYDTRRQMAFIGAASGCFNTSLPAGYERTKTGPRNFPGLELTSLGRQQGRVVAVDALTGKVKAEAYHPWPLYGGTLGTAGDLLIASQVDGKVMALDKDTLSELWSFNVGTTIAAPAITYAVDGKQYIAVAVGGALYRPDDFNTRELLNIQRNAQIVVFGL